MNIGRKITIISLSSVLSLASAAGVGYGIYANNLSIQNNELINTVNTAGFDENKDIIFDNNYYLNVKDATDYLLSSNEVGVQEELYIGDLSEAIISTNNYNMVNTKKLQPYDTKRDIKKAYKTSLGIYTDDMLKAKKSMIGSQETLYLDHEFNSFRSENRAKDSIDSSTNTIPVSYYKVYDPVREDYVNINPLNANDALLLKEIALNSTIGSYAENKSDKNKFTLEKYQIDKIPKATNNNTTDRYQKTFFAEQNFKGKFKELLDSVYAVIIKNAPFKVEVLPSYPPVITWGMGNNSAGISWRVDYGGGDLNNSTDFSKKLELMQAAQIAAKFDIFVNRDVFVQNFNVQNDYLLHFDKVFSKHAFGTKPLFGYDNFNIIYNGDRPWPAFGSSGNLGWNITDFIWGGEKANVSFKLGLKPYSLDSKHYADIHKIFVDKDTKILTEFLKENDISQINHSSIDWTEISSIDKRLKEFVTDAIIQNTWTNSNSDTLILDQEFLTVNYNKSNMLEKAVKQGLASSVSTNSNGKPDFANSTAMQELLIEHDLIGPTEYILNQAFGNDELYPEKESIYTINYNGSPLYHVDLNNFSINNENDEKGVVLKTVSNSISDAQSGNTYREVLDNLFINVSNNTMFDQSLNNKYLTKNESIINKNKKLINFDIGVKNKIVSAELTQKYNVEDIQLLAKLNSTKNDPIDVLKNPYGILQSIYYYNRNLSIYDDEIPYEVLDKMVKIVNEIPILWQTESMLEPTYYGEFLGKNTDLNEEIQNSSKRKVYNSEQEINEAINVLFKLQPIQLFVIKDFFNQVINFEYLDKNQSIANGKPISDGYGTNEEQAYQNALNKITIYADTNYVYYDNILVRNKVSKLYTLDLSKQTNQENVYSFIQYKYMYQYLYDFVKLNSVNIY